MSHEFWAKFDVPLADRDEARKWLLEFLRTLPGPVDYDLLDDEIAARIIREHARGDCEVTDVHHDIYLELEQGR